MLVTFARSCAGGRLLNAPAYRDNRSPKSVFERQMLFCLACCLKIHLRGAVENPAFLGVMDAIGQEQLKTFDVHNFMLLDQVLRTGHAPADKLRVDRLVNLGVIERLGHGKLVLARRLYQAVGKSGVYTRLKGLDRPQQKSLLLWTCTDSA